MNLARMAWRGVWARPLVTLLTVAGVALGVALIACVLTLRRETENTFLRESNAFDLVVGAKGSPLQLTLSSIYHIDIPTGNIPFARYEALKADRRVRTAIPIGLGDNYQGFRIVGTSPEFFDLRRKDSDSGEEVPLVRLAEGRLFAEPFEAVIGASVARETGLRSGSTFSGTHGLIAIAGSEVHDDHPYTVVGILAPSGSAQDRALFTPLESVWIVHDAEKDLHRQMFAPPPAAIAPEAEETDTDDDGGFGFLAGASKPVKSGAREVTAVLVQLKTPGMRLWMAEDIRNNTESMAAIPINEMHRLTRQVLSPMQNTLLAVAALVVVVAVLSVTATLYQAAERRRRDLAVMRALGAHPGEVFLLVFLEAAMLTLLGLVLGWILGHAAIALAVAHLREKLGLAITGWSFDPIEFQALAAILVAGLLAGTIPALLAYRRPPVRDLSSGP